MDENYLDSLLNEVSLDKEIDHRIEEELDNQIQSEKRQYQQQQTLSDEDLFNIDLEYDANSMQSEQELHFSQEQMDELDRLDDLADLDIGDLDFSDIDFDDLDITKLGDVETADFDDLLKEFDGDLEIDKFFKSSDEKYTEVEPEQSLSDDDTSTEGLDDVFAFADETEESEQLQKADLNEDSFDADQFLDSLLEETEPAKVTEEEMQADGSSDIDSLQASDLMENMGAEQQNDEELSLDDILGQSDSSDAEDDNFDLLAALEEFDEENSNSGQVESNNSVSGGDDNQLDDLFSLLDLDDLAGDSKSERGSSEEKVHTHESGSDSTMNLDDLDELPKEKQTLKQKLMRVIFGEPDEDDILTEEELAEIEKKKAAKKEKKEAAKKAREEKAEAAKEEKSIKSAQKEKEIQEKKQYKAKKKEYLRAEALEEKKNEKKLNKPVVIFIFTLFLGGTLLLFVGTDSFNYSLAIERATNYFAKQKYRNAYDEIVGVEVKEKDEDLKDRIYTVMYVERLYESYLNNIELERQEKALDSLLRGVSKYYEHYEEAEELGVASDLDYSFSQIQTVLSEQYGITIEDAIRINALSDYEYVEYIESMVSQKTDISDSAEVVQ